MKLANYRCDTLRFSVSLLLISIVILSNLIFYYSAESVAESRKGVPYFSEQEASVSGVLFDNCQELPACALGCEKIIENGFDNSTEFSGSLSRLVSNIDDNEICYLAFEDDQKSQNMHVAHYLKNCAIKIPFNLL